jgi:long-chain acyl-CoA synthetase
LERGDRVAVLLLNSPEYAELYYSTTLAGVAIVPLNTRWSLSEYVFSISDCGARVLIYDDRFASLVQPIRDACPCLLAALHVVEYAAAREASEIAAEWPEPQAGDLAGVFYTSGTTGGPKGAMLTQQNVYMNAVHAILNGLRGDCRYLHAAPMFHLADGATVHFTTFCGGSHHFLPSFDPELAMQTIERERIQATLLVPTMINMLVNHPAFARYDLSSLETLIYGASPMPLSLVREVRSKLPHVKLVQGYGMTETSPLLTILQPEDHCLDSADHAFAPVRSAGRPMMGVEVRVVDELDRPLPAGKPGEIVARGPNVMAGYWNRPEINREVLRGGWMHTGDIGVFDDAGYLYILDRKKDMIKTGGENVFSPEVESTILAHPAILETAVIGVPHPTWGETICAFTVCRAGAAVAEADVMAHCRERLAHFKCPTSVIFVESLPKGGTGKVQKTALRRLLAGAAAVAS